ncbi:MAG: class I SAM-dependent methyltransferase [Acidobacteriota bacterium]
MVVSNRFMQAETQDAICESLETLSQASPYYEWLASRVRPYLKGKVLEIGAGIGNFAKWAQQNVSEYHVSDNDSRLVQELSQQFSNSVCWDIFTPYPNNETFDTIVILNVVEHLEQDEEALRRIHARLNPGGQLILMVPAMNFLYGSLDRSFGHYRRYTKKSISRVIQQAGFQPLKAEYVNVVGMAGWFVYGKILKARNLPEQLCSRFHLVLPLLKLERPIAHFMGLSVIAIAKKI